MQDYYEILGVDRSASAADLKRAYRQLAMLYHPDRNQGNAEAEARFKAAAEAYEVLSNPEKRTRYDRFGHAGVRNGAGQGAGFQDVSDIFSALATFLEGAVRSSTTSLVVALEGGHVDDGADIPEGIFGSSSR